MKQLEADYLIVGSGAVGMAFADVIVAESDATVIIVDRYHKPGGHWNVAYPFVTLHQPSAFYGVSSRELSKGLKAEIGLNKGLNDLATGTEIMTYYDEVMRHELLPSGQVQYFPMCEYEGDNRFRSNITNEVYSVDIKKKLIDSTHLNTSVPSTHTPNFTVADGVRFMPINNIVNINDVPDGYVVIGGGKTGIDAILWLLEQNVNPDRIQWVVSRDAWLINRSQIQPSQEFFEATIGSQVSQFEALAQAKTIDDLFERLEAADVLMRLDPSIKPQMFHGATVSPAELAELRRIKNVIRLGRVQQLLTNEIVLDRGQIPTTQNTVHIDCSASAVTNLDIVPIFQGSKIIPQTVRSYQPVFSAALIAHVELAYDDDDKKNALCQVVPLPNHDTDWVRMMYIYMQNQFNWGQNKELRRWLYENRLDGFSKLTKNVNPDDTSKIELLNRLKASIMPAMMKLGEFNRQIESAELKS